MISLVRLKKTSEVLRKAAEDLEQKAQLRQFCWGCCEVIAWQRDHFIAEQFFYDLYYRDSRSSAGYWMGRLNAPTALRRLIALDFAACFAEDLEAAGLPVTLP
jgi:hypothetical protein